MNKQTLKCVYLLHPLWYQIIIICTPTESC